MKHAVFGSGITLINNWTIVKNCFHPEFALDNNSKKWGVKDDFTQLVCYSPESVANDGNLLVLITAGDPYAIKGISSQLEKLSIKHISLMEMVEQWGETIPLPYDLEQMKNDCNKIILFNTPEHDNIGDHLIALSEKQLINKICPSRKLFEVTDIEYMWHHNKIKKMISDNDILIISGGGFLGSLWLYNCEENVRHIIEEYPNNNVVIFPQTIYFEKNERGEKEFSISRYIYMSHKHLKICAREEESYSCLIKMLGSDENVFLLPDVGLFYETNIINKKHENCLVCLRNDKESILSDKEKNEIFEVLKRNGYQTKVTSMHEGVFDKELRKAYVEKKLEELSGAKLVITDTLHCMITAALVGTNCIFFNNISGKVKNVYKWIENNDYVRPCDKVENLEKILEKMDFGYHYFTLEDREKYVKILQRIIGEA